MSLEDILKLLSAVTSERVMLSEDTAAAAGKEVFAKSGQPALVLGRLALSMPQPLAGQIASEVLNAHDCDCEDCKQFVADMQVLVIVSKAGEN